MLRVRDLACTRGGLRVLDGVSLTLDPGQALVLRGPNGIGKTTLIRTLAGLQAPAAGVVEVAEDAIAYAAHADAIKPTLTVTENLRFWARVYGAGDIQDALQAFDLSSLRDRAAGSLSAGQKRRLGLARLVVTGRPLWILDEPTVSLDAENVARFAGVVEAHLSQGGAALMATHIDLGLQADVMDVTPFRATAQAEVQDDPFLEGF